MRNRTLYDNTYLALQSEYFINLRKQTGRSYDVVAYILNLKPSTFYKYEKGMRDMPVSVFVDLCLLYNKDYGEVFKELNKKTIEACGKTSLEDR